MLIRHKPGCGTHFILVKVNAFETLFSTQVLNNKGYGLNILLTISKAVCN
jgi:hypothetical protein